MCVFRGKWRKERGGKERGREAGEKRQREKGKDGGKKGKKVKGGRILETWGKYHMPAINFDMALISKLS